MDKINRALTIDSNATLLVTHTVLSTPPKEISLDRILFSTTHSTANSHPSFVSLVFMILGLVGGALLKWQEFFMFGWFAV